MVFQMPKSYEASIASFEITEKWSFSSMGTHMNFYISLFRKSFMADGAFKWFFAIMWSFMNLKSTKSLETLAAIFTLERLLTSVDELMCF